MEKELELLQVKREERQKEFIATRQLLSEALVALQATEEALAIQKNKKISVESSIATLRHEQATLQQNLLSLSRTEQQLQSELKQDLVRIENAQERLGVIEQSRQRQKLLLQELQNQMIEKKKQSEELSAEIDSKQNVIKECEGTIFELNDKIKSLTHEKRNKVSC